MTKLLTYLKLIIFSVIGIGLFFMSFTIGNKTTIGIDHIVIYVLTNFHSLAIAIVVAIISIGLIKDFYALSKDFSWGGLIFPVIRLLGLILILLYLLKIGQAWMFTPDMLPFLFEKLTLTVGILIPIGAIGLTFLINFGLIEFVGVFLEKLMRPLFRTPGSSAVDALASFVGSYSIGLLITSRMYFLKTYTLKESIIIATGFSTVSVTFMVVVAKTLNLTSSWNYFFWSSLVITFAVTAITAYVPPISRYPSPEQTTEQVQAVPLLQRAAQQVINLNNSNPSFIKIVSDNFIAGLNMAAIISSSIIAVGFIGLTLAKFTPLFDWIGLLFSPLFYITGIEGAVAASGKIIAGAAEMFLPAVLLKQESLGLRYLAGVVPIASVIFLSGTLPCILATKIPIKKLDLLFIWLIRTGLTIVLAGIAFHLGVAMGWLS